MHTYGYMKTYKGSNVTQNVMLATGTGLVVLLLGGPYLDDLL